MTAGRVSGTRSAHIRPPQPRHFPPGAIKQRFQEAQQALRPSAPVPQPKRRSRSGETHGVIAGAWKQAAMLIRPPARRPPQAEAAAATYLRDTLDWLNLWDGQTEGAEEDLNHDGFARSHLAPHP
ncbi:MAG: hypothetical protein JO033_24935 [Acidobacteriaceae bacterium]|nr:hypothetical protein [Acidobacteriaceae bacterium]